MRILSRWRMAALACAAGLSLAAAPVATAQASAAPARAASDATGLAVNYDFASAFLSTWQQPTQPPPGANNFACRSASHPYPVILIHGTFENMNDNWQAASPILVNHGYCVFAFDYGGSWAGADIAGTGNIATSAQQLASFVATVMSATGASKVDLVGHSQGGMMARYYINDLGGAATVDTLVALSPSNYGTSLDGLTTLANALGLLGPANGLLDPSCAACVQQESGSAFLTALNARPTVPSVRYTVIATQNDEVVTPYTNSLLPAAPNVRNIVVQNQCGLDQSDHLEISYDPVALADMLNALDPSAPVQVPCVLVLPVTGPVGPVPSF